MCLIFSSILGKPVYLLATCSEDTLVSLGSVGCILLSGWVYFYVQEALTLAKCISFVSGGIVFHKHSLCVVVFSSPEPVWSLPVMRRALSENFFFKRHLLNH